MNKSTILIAMLALAGGLAGCATLRPVQGDGGKGGYFIVRTAGVDSYILFCPATQDGSQTCKTVWKMDQLDKKEK